MTTGKIVVPELTEVRERLLKTAVDYFSRDPAVLGIFLGGSMPAGMADAYSDIDLRVVVSPDEHPRFVRNRLEMPKAWGDFLFNEWIEGAQHCVSHFRPFGKIDVFYISLTEFRPSPWYSLSTRVLYDPRGLVKDTTTKSKGLAFAIPEEEIDRSVSKGLASAHEAYRRIRRGELFFAQSLLDSLRHYMIQADDWIHRRPPQAVTFSGLEKRASQPLIEAFKNSYVGLDAASIEQALLRLLVVYREQIIALHKQFGLSRPLKNDLYAIDVIQAQA